MPGYKIHVSIPFCDSCFCGRRILIKAGMQRFKSQIEFSGLKYSDLIIKYLPAKPS